MSRYDVCEPSNYFSESDQFSGEKTSLWNQENKESHENDLVQNVISQNLNFNRLGVVVACELLKERQQIRDRNHHDIMSEITQISSELSCCNNQPYSLEARERKVELLRLKTGLEKLLREEDVLLWKDTEKLRQDLVLLSKKEQASLFRQHIISDHNGDKGAKDSTNSEHMPGA